MDGLVIRAATPTDMAEVTAIYNDVLLTSTAIFSDSPVTVEDRIAWLAARQAQGYPVLIAATPAGGVIGFASYGDFRAWPGYRHTVEHSIHIHRHHRGMGAGRALMLSLLEHAREQATHVMVAGIDASNAASIRFHERLGFERLGTMREVGRKFGRWLDLVLLQHFLDLPGGERP